MFCWESNILMLLSQCYRWNLQLFIGVVLLHIDNKRECPHEQWVTVSSRSLDLTVSYGERDAGLDFLSHLYCINKQCVLAKKERKMIVVFYLFVCLFKYFIKYLIYLFNLYLFIYFSLFIYLVVFNLFVFVHLFGCGI